MINKFKSIIDSNKNILVTLTACMIIISTLVIMSITTGFKPTSSNYDNIIAKLATANNNLSGATNKLSINVDLASEKLDESSMILQEIETLLLTTNFDDDDIYKCLSEITDKTSDLYDLTSYLIKHPNDLSDTMKLDKLSNYIRDCKLLYAQLNEHGIDSSFDSNTETFFENTINYVNTVITLSRDSDIKETATKDFLLKLEEATLNLKSMNQDLMPAVNKIREDKRSFDTLIDDINKKKADLEDIKNKVNLLSIPEDCVHYYNSLKDTLTFYSKYIDSFENSVLYEKSCGDYESNKADIDKKYKISTGKYNDVINSYNNYKKILDK